MSTTTTTNEPRALASALAQPAFATRTSTLASHVADRHVERWAPETSTGTSRVRPLRSLGFVDRLISPWVEAAQRSASLRLFNQYATTGMTENQGKDVSWVFPRPWYQDELDWMAAARRAPLEHGTPSQPLFTTRGTYVTPSQQAPQDVRHPTAAQLPPALYEFVAPSLSVAAPTAAPGTGFGGDTTMSRPVGRASEAFSPIVPLAAVQAADVMARTVSRLPATVAAAPALRSVLSTLLQRTTAQSVGDVPSYRTDVRSGDPVPTRLAMQAPELVTPPAPREDLQDQTPSIATVVAERAAQQHAQLAEIQRIARQSAVQREAAAAIATATSPVTQPAPAQLTSVAQQTPQTALVEEARRAQTAAQQQLEERVARRVAERTAQRLHEQARAEAIAHARAAAAETATPSAPVVESVATPAATPTATTTAAPPEVAAAIASLPPELASMLSRRPERAAQTIAELDQAYRAVELMARTAAAGGSFEVTRGPRLMMPAGLGGLVAAVEQAPSMMRAPDRATDPMTVSAPMLSMPAIVAQQEAMQQRAIAMQQRQQRAEAERIRTPALPWLAAPSAVGGALGGAQITPTSAFGATATAAPAALSHVAWSDRWLARFAGASPQSLETLVASSSEPRFLGVASTAPGAIFVSPSFDAVRDGEAVRFDSRGHVVVSAPSPMQALTPAFAPVAAVPAPVLAAPSPISGSSTVDRYDDDAETPDEVFAQISAAASQRRALPPVAPAPTAPTHLTTRAVAADADRPSLADTIAHASPSAPGAGLAAHLAASPFAPALRHVLAMPAASSFDVRALFGGALSTSYLAGLLAPESHEIEVATRVMPSWASWTAEPVTAVGERSVPSWDAAYVSPDALDEPAQTAQIATMQAQVVATQAALAAQAPLAAAQAPLTTVRSALLSWEADIPAASPMAGATPAMAAATGELRTRPIGAGTARELVEAMSLPLLGDIELPRTGETWAAPGMIAERAHGWSIAHERSTADLSFDFVPPELVLAARVYGLGPAEAAQAARLAIVGPGQLTAMAGTVDRTFVQAMQFEADRREGDSRRSTVVSARLDDTAATARVVAQTYPSTTSPSTTGEPLASASTPHPQMAATAFGVERRAPRGAFLWPQATVAALKLDAAGPDSQQSMSIAALELLAAQSVAELGTYAALSEPFEVTPHAGIAPSVATDGSTSTETPARADAPRVPALAPPSAELAEPNEQDVLQAAVALVPESRRARFEALYLALGRSPSSVGVSPAARAARALALAGRGEDAPLSARERAASAWDVLPVVYAVELGETVAAMAHETSGGGALTGSARARAEARASARMNAGQLASTYTDVGSIDVRPGLGNLSARAGEALSSYVAPSTGTLPSAPAASPSSSPQTFDRDAGALLRVPTAAQELVQTGRPSGRFGGGEVEIPTWFEAAARKMFESQSSTMGDGISMAELTLIQSMPSNQVAASSRSVPSGGASVATGAAGNAEPKPGQKVDIEKIANEIYRQILAMMDAARARNGEPYL